MARGNFVQVVALQWDKTSTKISSKYLDYADIFSVDWAIELPKNTKIHEHAIKLIDCKQLLYELINSLGPTELEILKIYIGIC